MFEAVGGFSLTTTFCSADGVVEAGVMEGAGGFGGNTGGKFVGTEDVWNDRAGVGPV